MKKTEKVEVLIKESNVTEKGKEDMHKATWDNQSWFKVYNKDGIEIPAVARANAHEAWVELENGERMEGFKGQLVVLCPIFRDEIFKLRIG